MSVSIRHAEPRDAEAIARMYNEGIEDRQATFETRLRSAADFEDPGTRPFLVAEEGGAVVGWARAGSYSSRDCYEGVAEAAIYVGREQRGSGVGLALFAALIADAKTRGYWKLIALVFPENRASVALCRRAGFREVGLFERHGRLDGEWRDVLLLERLLGEGARQDGLDSEPAAG